MQANLAAVTAAIEGWNDGDRSAFTRLCAPDAVHHSRFRRYDTKTVADANALVLGACPDLRLEIEDLIGADDWVVARLTARGTHTGTFLGLAPSGARVAFELIDIFRFAGDGKVVGRWGLSDELFALEQLGLAGAA